MSLVLHGGHLHPLILFDNVFLNRVKSLLAGEPAEHEHVPAHQSYSMRVPALIHWCARQDIVFLGEIDTRVLFRRGATASDQDFHGGQGNRC